MTVSSAFPIIATDDVDRARGFYVDVLGFTEVYRWTEPDGRVTYLTLEVGGSKVAFSDATWPALHGRTRGADAGNRFELCLDVDDVDATVTAARGAGSAVLLEPMDQPWGERAAYITDPDGTPILLVGKLSA